MGGVGRPRAFKSVEEVEEKINAYFNYCEEKEKPYTMSGLAYYLGIDRKTLLNYSKNEEYFHAIKKARDKVQMQLEECLYRLGNNSGVIFNLKNNFDWKDKMEAEKTDMTKVDELLKEIKDNASNE
jgi:hypothetical protein